MGDRTEKYPIRVLLETAFKRIEAEVYEIREDGAFRVDSPLKTIMVPLLEPLLTCLDLKTMSWSLFLVVSCALPHRPQLLNGLGFALFHHLRVIN